MFSDHRRWISRVFQSGRHSRPLPARGGGALRRVAVAGLVLASLSSTAHAGDLLINGVPVGRLQITVQGLDGVTFEGCTTVTVKAGSMDVACPGYDLKATQPGGSGSVATTAPVDPDAPPTLTRRYWAVPEQTVRGGTSYDIDLYVNSKWIRRFKGEDEQVAFEITRFLTAGENKLLFVSTRQAGKEGSGSEENYFRVVVGEGEISAGRVLIDQPLFEVRRTAADTQRFTEERKLVTR